MVIKMKYLFKTILILCICTVGCNNINNRDKISFKVPSSEIKDSLKVINSLLSSYSEINYYIDDANILTIGTNKIGKIDSLFLSQLKSSPSNFKNTDSRILSIILFLKNNGINSCFRHRDLGIIVYDYKPTKEDRFEDVRYIVLNDSQLDINSIRLKNSQFILDKKDSLLLIKPIDKSK